MNILELKEKLKTLQRSAGLHSDFLKDIQSLAADGEMTDENKLIFDALKAIDLAYIVYRKKIENAQMTLMEVVG